MGTNPSRTSSHAATVSPRLHAGMRSHGRAYLFEDRVKDRRFGENIPGRRHHDEIILRKYHQLLPAESASRPYQAGIVWVQPPFVAVFPSAARIDVRCQRLLEELRRDELLIVPPAAAQVEVTDSREIFAG